MEKYYIPSIEEFFVGFEYEFLVNHGSPDEKWEKRKLEYYSDGEDSPYYGLTIKSLHSYDNVFWRNAWRVKFLDEQDFIDLGFLNGTYKGVDIFEIKEGYYISYFKDNKIVIDNGEKHEQYDCYFQGTIKNKSELLRLINQIGVLC